MAHRNFMCFVIVFYSSNGFLNRIVAMRGDPGELALDFGRHQDTMLVEKGIFEARTQDITTCYDLTFLDTLVGFKKPLFVKIQSRNISTR
jgi:hypothetical protein